MPDELKPDGPIMAEIQPEIAQSKMAGQLTVPVQTPPTPILSAPHAPQRRWVWAGLAGLVLVMAGLWYVQPWVSKGLAVTTEVVTPGPLLRVLAVNGRLSPLHLVTVKPTVGGDLVAVLVDEGSVVQPGDVLARMDASGQQAIVRQAVAGLDASLVVQSQARDSVTRAEALGQNISRTALSDARAAQQTANQEVARQTALLDQAQIALARYDIVAPIAGTVLTRSAEVGQVIDQSTALFSVADLGQLVVETDVDESYATRMTVGLPAVLLLKGETAPRDGRVSFVAAQVDAATGGLAVKIGFDAPVMAPVGLTVTANIVVDRQDGAISVPRAALQGGGTGESVFLVQDGRAVRRSVTIVDWPADRVEVTQGLVAGDTLITDATGVSDGLVITADVP